MKHLKLLATLVLLTAFVVSLGMAGRSKSVTMTPQQGSISKVKRLGLDQSDIPGGRIKSTASRGRDLVRKDPSLAKPVPRKENLQSVAAGLSGTYHIPGDFATIGNAVAVLNFVGLAGNTTFLLDATTYTEISPVTFGSYPGNGTFTATFQPNAGIAATLEFISSNSSGKGIAFNGAKNVTIDGLNTGGSSLTIKYAASAVFPLGDPMAATIYITGTSSYIAIKNASVQGIVNDPVWGNQTEGRSAIFVWAPDADGAGSDHLTFDGVTVTNATYAFKMLMEGALDYTADHLTITNCRIGGAFGVNVVNGGYYEVVTNVLFANNITDGVYFLQNYWYNTYTEFDDDIVFGVGAFFYNLGQSTGAHFLLVDAGVFHDNIWRNIGTFDTAPGDGVLTYGTRILQSNLGLNVAAQTYNNRVYNLTNQQGPGSQINGIRGTAGHVYHNSVQLTGVADANVITNCVNGVTDAVNNALSNEMTGGVAGNTRAIATGGTIDHNALYSTGIAVSGFATASAAAAGGQNVHGTFGPINFTSDLHLNAAGPSSAENIGFYHVLAANDIDGDARDTTIIGTRDAGADEVSAALGAPWTNDVSPGAITSPVAGGVPLGLSQTPVVVVKNNTGYAAGPFNLRLQVSDGYDNTVSVSLAPEETKSVTFPSWTPASATTFTFTATSSLAGDVVPGNDVYTRAQPVQAPLAVTTTKLWDWNATDDGWTRSVDWVRKSTFTKIGGPYAGASMVTERPNLVSTYTEGAYANTQGYASTYPGANILTSPWLDLSGMSGGDVYVSFVQSMNTEPGWDISWMEYTTDGVTWSHLGSLNDANGINWYNSNVYKNAQSNLGDPPDTVTMKQYGLIPNGSVLSNFPNWTSNGDPNGADVPTGPNGWVYNQLHITAATYPAIVHAPIVKFRYVAFSDAVGSFEGWGVDNFQVSNAPTIFAGGSITGKAFEDVNGNGVYDAGTDVIDASRAIYRAYFGVALDTTTTDVNGDYTFSVALPGVYNLTINRTGVAWTDPLGPSSTVNINHPATGGTITQNFAAYNGSISGTKFSDTNDNGAFDGGEPGKAGWTVEVHKDSLNGALWGSAVTNGSGNYSIAVVPGTWYVKEVAQPAAARKTLPAAAGYTTTVSGASGSGTALVTGVNFGNFFFASIRVEASIDVFGDGNKDVSDHTTLPALVTQSFEFRKNGALLTTDVLGNTIASILHSSLDTGVYTVKRVSATPAGWLKTSAADSFTFVVANSGDVDTANSLYFKLVVASGHKFNDLNGNGAQDVGEPGIANWPINVTGTGGGTVNTDVNGDWSIATLAGGSHTISEGAVAGWTQTFAASGLTFTAQSGNLPGANKPGRDFGNYKNVCISGVKYRDRNNNGSQDGGEEGLSGWTINVNPGGYTATTDANGNWQICDILPTNPNPDTVTITETAQLGWNLTEPALGSYVVVLHSGDSLTGYKFGNFKGSDTTKYRTYTATQYALAGNVKPAKAPTVKKPTIPNLGNLINDIFLQSLGSLQVGLSGQLNAGGKEKAYVLGAKQADVFKTFNNKTLVHTGPARGLDFDNVAKPLLKRYKNLPSSKKNDMLLADLLALKINIVASGVKTPAGLGSLKYSDAGHPLNGQTISQIASGCDVIMTNWEGIPFSTFTMYDTVIAKINAAFSDGLPTFVYDSASWWSAGKFKVRGDQGYATVYAIPFLTGNPGVAPTQTPVENPVVLPTVYALQQNYPNPFNPTTSIAFDVPEASIVTLKIYNMLGQEVATLLDRQVYDGATSDEVEFDASTLASGVYLYRIVAQSIDDNGMETGNTFTQVKKMVLVK